MNFLDHTYFAYPRGVTKKICEDIIEYGEGKIIQESYTQGTSIPREESKRNKTLKKIHKIRNSQTACMFRKMHLNSRNSTGVPFSIGSIFF